MYLKFYGERSTISTARDSVFRFLNLKRETVTDF